MSGNEHEETPLERALRAPGSPEELSEEQRYVAMFRASRPAPAPVVAPAVAPAHAGRRALVRRLSAGSTLAAVFAVASAGVAAAYASSLPDPVQRVFHSVLAPIGVPPVESQGHVQTPQARPTPEPSPPDASPAPAASSSATEPSVAPSQLPTDPPSQTASDGASPSDDASGSASPTDSASPSTSPSTSPSESPTASPSDPTASPTTSDASSPSATTSPSPTTEPTPSTPTTSPTPTTEPTPTVTAAPTAVATPASVSIVSAGAGQRVAPGGTAVVTGRVAADNGSAVPDVPVTLQVRGPNGWHRYALARTASDGTVSVTAGPLQETTSVRLRAGGVPSAAWQIQVQPTLAVSAQTVGAVTALDVSASGGRTGDTVVLLVRRNGALVQQARGTLDASGKARFDVPTPLRTTRYVVRLPATATHGFASSRLAVDPPMTPPTATTATSPSATP